MGNFNQNKKKNRKKKNVTKGEYIFGKVFKVKTKKNYVKRAFRFLMIRT